MQIQQGWLSQCKRVKSPNADQRPCGEVISLLVIHNISLPPQQFGGPYIEQLFCNCLDPLQHSYFEQIHDLKVSSHLLIDRLGKIIQFVPFDKRAWHAGVSEFEGRESCNDFSIGIELEGADTIPFTPPQYQSLTAVTKLLISHYPALSTERIVGHSDIAPGRKTDPGPAFDWQLFKNNLR
jgi:AmpD protein